MKKKDFAIPAMMFFIVFLTSMSSTIFSHKTLETSSLLFILFCSIFPGLVYWGVITAKKKK